MAAKYESNSKESEIIEAAKQFGQKRRQALDKRGPVKKETRGRKKGGKNAFSLARPGANVAAILSDLKVCPIATLAYYMQHAEKESDRIMCAKFLADKYAPSLKAIEHEGSKAQMTQYNLQIIYSGEPPKNIKVIPNEEKES